ncbi:MAG: hypothetical protein OQL06_09825 [Gammaproteobacteria bacterium]|nr:hypothetical protein [Gammaproteobacteria bacterium]
MKRCKSCTKAAECRKKNLPYLIAIPFAVFAAILTWVAMTVAGLPPNIVFGASAFALVVGGGAIMLYMEFSVERHCIDDQRRQQRLTT